MYEPIVDRMIFLPGLRVLLKQFLPRPDYTLLEADRPKILWHVEVQFLADGVPGGPVGVLRFIGALEEISAPLTFCRKAQRADVCFKERVGDEILDSPRHWLGNLVFN